MKKILYTFLLLGSLVTFIGCEESNYEELIPQQYGKILYLKNSGQNNISLYNDGVQVKYSVTIVKAGSNPAATAQVRLSTLTQEEIDNDSRYKGNNYVVLNSDCYSFRSKDLTFDSNDLYKVEDFTLDPQKIGEQMEASVDNPNSIFILPIRLSSKTDSVNYEKRDVIIKPTVKQLGITFEKNQTSIDLGVNKEEEVVTEIKVTMMSGIINKWDFTAGLSVSTDQNEVDAFNVANGTDYKAIPANAFDVPEKLIFNDGISESIGVLVVNRSKLSKGSTYLVPLQLEQSEEIDNIVSDTKKHYVILKYLFDMEKDKIDLKGKIEDPFGWTGEGSINNLTDGLGDTFWGTKYSKSTPCGNPEYGISFDMHIGKDVQSIMFKYVTRFGNANATPTVIKLFISSDNGKTWEDEPLATLTKDANRLPQDKNIEFTSSTYSSDKAFNCIRFSIMESKQGICDGQHLTDDEKFAVSTALTAISLWGM